MNKRVLIVIIISIFLPVFVFAEELEVICQQLSESENNCNGLGSVECRVQLEKCAVYYDEQSAEISKDLTKTAQQKNTLQSKVNSLKNKITGLNYQINQGTVIVKDLSLQIKDTQGSIDKTALSIEESKNQIATILRAVNEEDKKSSLVILMEGSLSDFFSNLSYLESLNSRISGLLESTSNLKFYLEGQIGKQESEKTQLQKTIQVQNLQKQENEKNKKEQEGYLKLTEAQYNQQLKEKQDAEKKASAIKSRIFELLGVSDAPNFQQAYDIAKYVSGATGVRAALILAVLTQASKKNRRL